MSKVETVRRLNDSAPQLQIVAAVRELRASLDQIPAAVSETMAESLGQLDRMAEAVDRMSAAQRQTFEQLLARARQDQTQMQEAATEASMAASSLTESAQRLQAQAQQRRPWAGLMGAMLAGTLAGAMVLAGMTVLSGTQPAAEPLDARTQQEAAAWRQLWDNASESERDRISQILQRQRPQTPPDT